MKRLARGKHRGSWAGAGSHRLVQDLTPMIDVVFLLIIFFMTTARFAQITRADLDLPREPGEQRDNPEEAGLVINIAADGTIIVANNELSLDELAARVARRIENDNPDNARALKLMIRADRNLPAGRLNEIIARLESMGVGAARLATEVP